MVVILRNFWSPYDLSSFLYFVLIVEHFRSGVDKYWHVRRDANPQRRCFCQCSRCVWIPYQANRWIASVLTHPAAVGSGTIADIWEPRERGQAMGFFYLGPLMGPLLGPIIGGLLDQKLGWRSTQWFLAIYAGGLLVFLFFALPETLKVLKPIIETPHTETTDSAQPELSRVRSRRSVQRKTQNGVKIIKRIFIDPLKILLYLRFPAVIITVYYASIAFGSLYLLNVSMETTFSRPPYNFSSIQLGLAYIPSSVGYLAASVFAGRWSDRIMAREAKPDGNGDLVYKPEDRMRENAWIAAFLYPSALIWYGWTSEKHLFWAIPVSIPGPLPNLLNRLIYSHATARSEPFLWNWLYDHLRYGYNYAHGIHASQSLRWRCSEQFHPKYLRLRCRRRRWPSHWRYR